MRNEKGQFEKGFQSSSKPFLSGHKVNLGRCHSDETKSKLRLANKGKKPWNTGKHLTEEHRKKLSESHKGFTVSEETKEKLRKLKGDKSHNWKGGKDRYPKCEKCGKRLTVLSAKHCQLHQVRPFVPKSLRGNLSHNWKGGLTPINQRERARQSYINWRKSVFIRDKFTCQKYGTIGGKLVAHHINNFADFPELRTSIENGITLSEKAHQEFHKKYGKRNNSLEQLQEYLSFNK